MQRARCCGSCEARRRGGTSPSYADWPLNRPADLLETSRPGVFAVGDVRSHDVKALTSAVGGGPIAVSFVHHVLQKS